MGNPTEFSFNARVAANLGAPVVLVVTGREPTLSAGRDLSLPARSVEDVTRVSEPALTEIRATHASPVALIVNRANAEDSQELKEKLGSLDAHLHVGVIPEDAFLVSPTVASVMAAVGGTLLQGDEQLLEREALGVMVGAMSLENIIVNRPGFNGDSVYVISANSCGRLAPA